MEEKNQKVQRLEKLSFISYGIALIGYIVAWICILCVHSKNVNEPLLGGCISFGCLVIASFCQIAFVKLSATSDVIDFTASKKEHFYSFATKTFMVLSIFLALTVPLFFIKKLNAEFLIFICSWSCLIFPLAISGCYCVFFKKSLEKEIFSDDQNRILSKKRKNFVLKIIFSLSCLIILFVVALLYKSIIEIDVSFSEMVSVIKNNNYKGNRIAIDKIYVDGCNWSAVSSSNIVFTAIGPSIYDHSCIELINSINVEVNFGARPQIFWIILGIVNIIIFIEIIYIWVDYTRKINRLTKRTKIENN